jgi:hypothetical protein
MAADFMVELRKGSFTDIDAANRHINATLPRNRVGVDRVVEGKSSRAALDALFGWETGREAFVTGGKPNRRFVKHTAFASSSLLIVRYREATGSTPLFREISIRRPRHRNTGWIFTTARAWR